MKFDELYHVLIEKNSKSDYAQHDVAVNRLLQFIEERKAGAEKIASQASKKAGVSRLTAAHFKAKLPLYDKIHKAVKQHKSLTFINKQYKKTLSELRKTRSNAIRFQKLTGEMEVLGEILIESNKL